MPTSRTTADPGEAGIFLRVLSKGRQRLTPEFARYLLELGFSDADKARMHDLAVRNQDGSLSARESQELMDFVSASDLLGILQSLARRVLKKKKVTGRPKGVSRGTHG